MITHRQDIYPEQGGKQHYEEDTHHHGVNAKVVGQPTGYATYDLVIGIAVETATALSLCTGTIVTDSYRKTTDFGEDCCC